MSVDANKVCIQQFIDAVNEKGLESAVEQYLAPTYLDHGAPPSAPAGPTGWRRLRSMVFTAFPDLQIMVEEMVAEGDKVAVRWRMHATHDGERMGIPPTGRRIAVSTIDVVRVADGKVVEHWDSTDTLGMLQHLDVIRSRHARGA